MFIVDEVWVFSLSVSALGNVFDNRRLLNTADKDRTKSTSWKLKLDQFKLEIKWGGLTMMVIAFGTTYELVRQVLQNCQYFKSRLGCYCFY